MSVVSSVRLLARLRAERDEARAEAADFMRLAVHLRRRCDELERRLRRYDEPFDMSRIVNMDWPTPEEIPTPREAIERLHARLTDEASFEHKAGCECGLCVVASRLRLVERYGDISEGAGA